MNELIDHLFDNLDNVYKVYGNVIWKLDFDTTLIKLDDWKNNVLYVLNLIVNGMDHVLNYEYLY